MKNGVKDHRMDLLFYEGQQGFVAEVISKYSVNSTLSVGKKTANSTEISLRKNSWLRITKQVSVVFLRLARKKPSYGRKAGKTIAATTVHRRIEEIFLLWFNFKAYKDRFFQTDSIRAWTAGLMWMGLPHSRCVSPGNLLVASMPILEPKPAIGEAKSK